MKTTSYFALLLLVSGVATLHAAGVVELAPGDHICLVGNAQGEALQHFNYWETLLHARFPQHELVVRNLCFPADEPYLRPRSANFGSPDEHLGQCQANVILYFFGLNESFQGPGGVGQFTVDLTRLIRETKKSDYGKGPPRVVLISPLAHEDLQDPNLPDGDSSNRNLASYTSAMADVARELNIGFVDMFTPSHALFAGEEKLTINGIHVNEAGAEKVASILDRGLFGVAKVSPEHGLRQEIEAKNFYWRHRYRAVNGCYIYGSRSLLRFEPDKSISNADVMERERLVLAQMVANRDRRIWAIAQGISVTNVDDTNTSDLLQVETNFHAGRQRGKQGQLDYLTVAQATEAFTVADGYRIECFASEEDFPELANPAQFTFDGRGRLWVTCMPGYPQYRPKEKLQDKLLILEDTNADGKADKCTTFADGLHLPTGVELGDGGAYVAQQPDLLFLKDTDGDDHADERVRVLRGFDSADSHHAISTFTWGPGGGLYFQEGTFHHTQVETPYGPTRLKHAGIFRYEPRTEKLDVFVSYGFANPWGHVFDRWGRSFVADASGGDNYFSTPFSGHVEYPRKHARLKQFIRKRFRPTAGCELVSSRHFPDEAQGRFLLNNCIGQQGIYQYEMADDGSGFAAKEVEPLVFTTDGNFRPIDLQFGPDGALYVCDWHNALVGHMQHSIRDPQRDDSHGRIYRITYKTRDLLSVENLQAATTEQLVSRLAAYEDRTRYRVRRELRSRDTEDVMTALDDWVRKLEPADADYEHRLLEALWVHQHHNVVNEVLLKRILDSTDYRARAAATRIVGDLRDRLHALELLGVAATDDHPRVRLEAVRACSFMTSDAQMATEIALSTLEKESDYYLEYTLNETIETLAQVLATQTPHSPSGRVEPKRGEGSSTKK